MHQKERQEQLAKELETAAQWIRKGQIHNAKVLTGSIHNTLRFHWCDRCGEYTKDMTGRDSDDRDLCRTCTEELGAKVEADTWRVT